MQTVDVYDFDGTIYRGDSTADYIAFVLGKRKTLVFYLLSLIPDVIRLLLTKDLTVFKSRLFGVLARHIDLEETGRMFWESGKSQAKINDWFRSCRRDVPVIIASASPDFELKWIARQLKTDLICTRCDAKTGQLIGKNCKSSEKISRIREMYGDFRVRAMYTDSVKADRPLLELAQEQYLVHPKTGKVTRMTLDK